MKHLLFSAMSLALAGCVGAANPPSLMPRAIEKRGDEVAVRHAVAVRPVSSELAKQIAGFVGEARQGDDDFDKVDRAGARAIAAGRSAAQGSEAWLSAQQYFSALQVARQRSAAAQSALDSLAVAHVAATANDPALGGLSQIEAAQQTINAIVVRQTARIEALGA